MYFLPKAPQTGMVADPDALARDFVEAKKISSSTTQYQWAEETFKDRNLLEKSTHVKFMVSETSALLNITDAREPILKDTSGGYDTDLVQVPYNMSLAKIDDMELTWTSKYPELVKIIFSFQYCRLNRSGFGSSGLLTNYNIVRFIIKLDIDGYQPEGAGCYKLSNDGSVRGTGFAGRSMAACITYVGMLPAGNHKVVPVVGQADSRGLNAFNNEYVSKPLATPPAPGVCVGNRSMSILRFARGKMLEA
tara:strand:+ start:1422 stop:2168 length:747 start_codon:yes stop_codon:yes gene_type:complete